MRAQRSAFILIVPIPDPMSSSERGCNSLKFCGCGCHVLDRAAFQQLHAWAKTDIHLAALRQRFRLSFNREKSLRRDKSAMFRVLPDVVRGVSCTAFFVKKCVHCAIVYEDKDFCGL